MTSDSSERVIILCRQGTIVPVEGVLGFSYCYCFFHQPRSRISWIRQHLDVGAVNWVAGWLWFRACSARTEELKSACLTARLCSSIRWCSLSSLSYVRGWTVGARGPVHYPRSLQSFFTILADEVTDLCQFRTNFNSDQIVDSEKCLKKEFLVYASS